jgi:hypothetical protein
MGRTVSETVRARGPSDGVAARHGGKNPTMELHAVRYDVSERVATVTLDRPHRLNAWTGRMNTEYRWCLAEAERDPAVRVVVVTGAGRGFCAGADFGALERNVAAGGYDDGVREPLAAPGHGVRSEFDHAFAFHADQHDDVGTAVERAVALTDRMMGEGDYAEGVQAWLDKRPPAFADPVDGPGARPG